MEAAVEMADREATEKWVVPITLETMMVSGVRGDGTMIITVGHADMISNTTV
jgi:hypothetical protein